ncbi:helix-turn-helix transcriptional regulator [Streptomyces sp. NPDC088794]|uniref:helix-turn-helix transcriptional regulator n=1 Tax=Streptomyces sp. NPDC088794 TaxID=3365902 RepID=UPI0038244C88
MESGGISAWRIGGDGPPLVDVRVPYADENRNHVLVSEWRRQSSDMVPPPPLLLPRHSEGAYRVRIRAQRMLDLQVEDLSSHAISGSTGGPGGHQGDGIVTHVTFGGEWRFAARGRRGRQVRVGAGTLCVRKNVEPWDFEVDRSTRALAVTLPASALRFPANTLSVSAEQTSPAARLLLAHLRLFAETADLLAPASAASAREAAVELFRGVLNEQVVDDAEFAPALLAAATDYIEDRLLDGGDLSPRDIADALHVSPRTLYRVFAQHSATSSVMAYVRERRLERARAELVATRLTVSELAARWRFADSSHFVKAYRKRFGETPTTTRRG